VEKLFQDSRLACLSLVCLLGGLLFLWFFLTTGANHRLGSTADKIVGFAVLSPCLIAGIVAVGALIWDRRKLPGVVALLAAAGAVVLVYSRIA